MCSLEVTVPTFRALMQQVGFRRKSYYMSKMLGYCVHFYIQLLLQRIIHCNIIQYNTLQRNTIYLYVCMYVATRCRTKDESPDESSATY